MRKKGSRISQISPPGSNLVPPVTIHSLAIQVTGDLRSGSKTFTQGHEGAVRAAVGPISRKSYTGIRRQTMAARVSCARATIGKACQAHGVHAASGRIEPQILALDIRRLLFSATPACTRHYCQTPQSPAAHWPEVVRASLFRCNRCEKLHSPEIVLHRSTGSINRTDVVSVRR